MASARTAAVSWWHGRSESSRKLPGRGRVERLFANAISGLSSNKTRNKLPKTRHRSRTGSESWRRVSVAGGTAFLHHSVRDEATRGSAARHRLSSAMLRRTRRRSGGLHLPSPWDVQPVPLWTGRHDEAARVWRQGELRDLGAIGSKDA